MTIRNLSNNTNSDRLQLSYVKKTPEEEQNDDDNDEDVKVIVETEATRQAREKAEQERLSFVEKFVKKYLPSQINSIAIFVNFLLLNIDMKIKSTSCSGCSWRYICYI